MNFFQKTFSKNPFAFSDRFSYLIAGAKVTIKSEFARPLLNIFRNYYIFLIIHRYTYIYIYKGRRAKTIGIKGVNRYITPKTVIRYRDITAKTPQDNRQRPLGSCEGGRILDRRREDRVDPPFESWHFPQRHISHHQG